MGLENNLSIRRAKQELRRESRIVIFADEYIQANAGNPLLMGVRTREGMITWEGYTARALLDVAESYAKCKKLSFGVLLESPHARHVFRQAEFAYSQTCEEWKALWKTDSNDFEIQH